MKIFDKNNKLIYECNLKGDELRAFYRKEIGLKEGYASMIFDLSFYGDCMTPIDVRYIIELAARKYDYLQGLGIKSWNAVYGHGIVFTELET